MKVKKNSTIQLIRIVAMLMIILDHLIIPLDFPMKSIIFQVSNSGVFIFLFLSGYLYGNKLIQDWRDWFLRRIIRICMPMWIFMIFDFVVEAILWHTFDIKLVFVYALNMQGIFGTSIASGTLWFLTLLMICYMITPILQYIKGKKAGKNVAVSVSVIAVCLQIVLAYTTDVGMAAGHTVSWCVIAIAIYVIGYFGGERILPMHVTAQRIIKISVLTVIAVVAVVFFRSKYDGQIVYDRIIFFYAMAIVDLWICTVFCKLSTWLKRNWQKKVLDYVDSISYEIYIVHCLVLTAFTWEVLKKYGVAAYVISTLVLSWIAAVILHWVCGKINGLFTNK